MRFYPENITQRLLVNNIVLISATTILRMITLACSGVLSHKGAYGALYRVRCMIVEHLAKVPLGVLDDRSTGEIKTVLNEDIEKLELCLAHNIPELVSYLTGPIDSKHSISDNFFDSPSDCRNCYDTSF